MQALGELLWRQNIVRLKPGYLAGLYDTELWGDHHRCQTSPAAFRVKLHGHAHLEEPVKHLWNGEPAVDGPWVIQPGVEGM